MVWLKDGSTQCVDDIEIVELPEGEYVAVYNFEVADFHTYFVSDYDVLVHNKCKKPNGYETGDKVLILVDFIMQNLVQYNIC